MKANYPVYYIRGHDSVRVVAPDIPGCYSFARDLPSSRCLITDCLCECIALLERLKHPVPPPTPLETLFLPHGAIAENVFVDTTQYRKEKKL